MPFDVSVEEPQEEQIQPAAQPRDGAQNQTQPSATPQGTARVSDLQAQLDKIVKDPKHAYWNTRDSGNPAHKDAVAEVTRLNQALAGLKDGVDAKLDKAGQPDPKASTLDEARPADWKDNHGVENETGFRSLASELGLPREMVDGAVAEIAKAGVGQAYADGATAEAAARAALGDEGFETAQVHANVAVDAVPGLREYLLTTNLANNIAVFKYLAAKGQEMTEAKAKIGELQKDERYTDSRHAEHRLAVLEAQRLHKILAPFQNNLR